MLLLAGPVRAQAPSDDRVALPNVPDELKPVVNNVAEYALQGLESQQLAAELARFGFTDETVAELLSQRINEGSPGASRTSVAMWPSTTHRPHRRVLRRHHDGVCVCREAPRQAEKPAARHVGGKRAGRLWYCQDDCVDSGTVGPFAFVFPVLDPFRTSSTSMMLPAARCRPTTTRSLGGPRRRTQRRVARQISVTANEERR